MGGSCKEQDSHYPHSDLVVTVLDSNINIILTTLNFAICSSCVHVYFDQKGPYK